MKTTKFWVLFIRKKLIKLTAGHSSDHRPQIATLIIKKSINNPKKENPKNQS
ncbi:hypothetical protein QMA06_06895 [Winogradskyella sp. APC 3343]|uniref:Uncharacterized protein n=1 Tax=Winogradskyella bathintestinalis TaxID=3035208 RepID=A0ABT7ZTW1_9FLAO|nr:hypothetical protein [Winogradskyella bathintestinalis]